MNKIAEWILNGKTDLSRANRLLLVVFVGIAIGLAIIILLARYNVILTAN